MSITGFSRQTIIEIKLNNMVGSKRRVTNCHLMPGIILFSEIATGPIHRKGVDADPHGEGKITQMKLIIILV